MFCDLAEHCANGFLWYKHLMKDLCGTHGILKAGDANEVLSSAGLRRTTIRVALIEIFSRWKKPHSQKELLEALQKKGLDGIDRVTIYRNLNQFVEAGIIHEVATNSYISCDHLFDTDHESHLILFCAKCEKHAEVCEDSDKVFFERLMGRTGFFARSGQLLISGLCRDCSGNAA